MGAGGHTICVFVCLCIHASVRPWGKSAITFDSFDQSAWNFQGQFNSLQVFFGQVIWTPRPSGSGPDPKKWVFCQIDLLPCRCQFGGLDKRAPSWNSLEHFDEVVMSCVVRCNSWRVCIFRNQKMHFYLIPNLPSTTKNGKFYKKIIFWCETN